MMSESLRKALKSFLRDWSGVCDEGKRTETFIACHLLKAVEGWTDLGLGGFQLVLLCQLDTRHAPRPAAGTEKDGPCILIMSM
jgi:hypothetical protein